ARPEPVTPNKNKKQLIPPPLKGAGHSWEIEYALGNLKTNPVYAWTPEDYKVSATMQQYFAHFIKSENPNGKALPHWEANTADKPVRVMHINVESALQPAQHEEQFEFLDRYYNNKFDTQNK